MKAYLDNAATTPIHPEVQAAMDAVVEIFGNPSSIHHHGRQARALIEKARNNIAAALGVAPGEIIFTSGGTEALNTALWGAVVDHNIRTIITSPIEHKAVLRPLERFRTIFPDLQIHYIHHHADGTFELDEVEHLLKQTQDTALVALMHANNELGVLNDVASIGTLARQYGALYLCDTVQTLGHVPFQMGDLQADYAACSAHKFHGPKGIGFLYMRQSARVQPLLWGGAQERGMRAGTENVIGIVGLQKAFELAFNDLQRRPTYLLDLRNYFRNALKARFPEITIFEPIHGQVLPTVLAVSFPLNERTEMLQMRLDIEGVAVSAGSACTSGSAHRSHVLESLGFPADRVPLRFSFGYMTTRAEIDYALDVLQKLLG